MFKLLCYIDNGDNNDIHTEKQEISDAYEHYQKGNNTHGIQLSINNGIYEFSSNLLNMLAISHIHNSLKSIPINPYYPELQQQSAQVVAFGHALCKEGFSCIHIFLNFGTCKTP